MRIVDRKTFLDMPAGILFSKYQPHYFTELSIKGESWLGSSSPGVYGDFISLDLLGIHGKNWEGGGDYFDWLEAMISGSPSGPLDFECGGRDALFDADQLFAVWEKPDIEGLMRLLTKAHDVTPDKFPFGESSNG